MELCLWIAQAGLCVSVYLYSSVCVLKIIAFGGVPVMPVAAILLLNGRFN